VKISSSFCNNEAFLAPTPFKNSILVRKKPINSVIITGKVQYYKKIVKNFTQGLLLKINALLLGTVWSILLFYFFTGYFFR